MRFAPQWRAFFNISISKSGLALRCLARFDFKMCFAPQQRAFFQHLNFQKRPGTEVFCTLWPRHDTFQHLNFQKWSELVLTSKRALRRNGVHFFHISTSKSSPTLVLTSKRALRHTGVQFFMSHLAKWLCTCCFSEPIFRSRGATSHWKNTANRGFFYLFAHLHLLLSDSFSRLFVLSSLISLLLFSSLLFSSLLFSDSSQLLLHPSILSEIWSLNFPSTNCLGWPTAPVLHLQLSTKICFVIVCQRLLANCSKCMSGYLFGFPMGFFIAVVAGGQLFLQNTALEYLQVLASCQRQTSALLSCTSLGIPRCFSFGIDSSFYAVSLLGRGGWGSLLSAIKDTSVRGPSRRKAMQHNTQWMHTHFVKSNFLGLLEAAVFDTICGK